MLNWVLKNFFEFFKSSFFFKRTPPDDRFWDNTFETTVNNNGI